jgi:hypothetical protein
MFVSMGAMTLHGADQLAQNPTSTGLAVALMAIALVVVRHHCYR